MPPKRVNDLVAEAPKGVVYSKEDLARLIAGALSLWKTLYPNESLVVEVKKAWKQQT